MKTTAATIRVAVLTALALAAGSCASTSSGDSSGGAPGVLTQEQLIETRQSDLYRAIESLRSRWLRPRAQATLTQMNQVMVYLNDSPFGPVDQLSTIPLDAVRDVRYLSASEATGRYGTGVGGGGIILVRTMNE